MDPVLDDLLHLLKLERIEKNIFRGESRDIGGAQVFGGQVLGQALSAAHHTVEGRRAHSLHAYFLRRGDMSAPIIYDVDRARDGGSFSVRRVVAIDPSLMQCLEQLLQSTELLDRRAVHERCAKRRP